jgi:uncharacterized membrane protein YadS
MGKAALLALHATSHMGKAAIKARIKVPWFIGLFVVAICLNTYAPAIQYVSHTIVGISKGALTVTLFLIGCGLSGKTVMSVGWKPVLQGLILWLIVSMSTLVAIIYL